MRDVPDVLIATAEFASVRLVENSLSGLCFSTNHPVGQTLNVHTKLSFGCRSCRASAAACILAMLTQVGLHISSIVDCCNHFLTERMHTSPYQLGPCLCRWLGQSAVAHKLKGGASKGENLCERCMLTRQTFVVLQLYCAVQAYMPTWQANSCQHWQAAACTVPGGSLSASLSVRGPPASTTTLNVELVWLALDCLHASSPACCWLWLTKATLSVHPLVITAS